MYRQWQQHIHPQPPTFAAAAVCTDLPTPCGCVASRPRERLTDFGRMLALAEQAGTITTAVAERLGGAGLDSPADPVVARARDLREAF